MTMLRLRESHTWLDETTSTDMETAHPAVLTDGHPLGVPLTSLTETRQRISQPTMLICLATSKVRPRIKSDCVGDIVDADENKRILLRCSREGGHTHPSLPTLPEKYVRFVI